MIKLIKPYISFQEIEKEFQEIFESGYFTRGPYVKTFAERIKEYTKAKHAYLATSATTALWACMRLLNIMSGHEVIVSDFSFPATANIVEDVGAKPVFADVSPDTFNMLPEELEKKITPKTKAVLFVDALGNPSGIHEIKEICQKHQIPLIEDAACAMGSSERDVKCGNIADLTCFSFHPRKLLTTGEGGAITTNSDRLSELLAVKLAHGSIFHEGKYDFVDFGYNFRLPELQAVMGIKQIEKLDAIVQSRNAIRNQFIQELEPIGFKAQRVSPGVEYNVQSLVFQVPKRIQRDWLVNKLKDAGIETTLGTYCLSGTTYYRKRYNNVQPKAWELQNTTITFPCYEGLDVDFICNAVRRSLQ
ncbi:MAG: DegT/DnrJ/EryC1/StrS family aminotransferase [Candidatus Brocadiae bacterium]|nr:DegT/DnrJ/EryC1/StrS family aminotransferase [Candidatus Brocadiia bacterium]